MKELWRFRTFGGLIIAFLISFLLLSQSATVFAQLRQKKEAKKQPSHFFEHLTEAEERK